MNIEIKTELVDKLMKLADKHNMHTVDYIEFLLQREVDDFEQGQDNGNN